jgi:hypothetical protein
MKLNKILMVLAATAIVGCTTDDVSDFTANQANDDSRLVQLDPNFVLAGVGEEGNVTRTHWEWSGVPGKSPLRNKFLPIWASAPLGGNTIDVDADLTAEAVGLCWLGNGAVGTDVYTNYEFYHFGWLKNGETKAKFECGNLSNGAFYNEITVAAGDAAGDEADETNFTVPGKANPLNYNSGIYKTDNKAIFGGQYIVYYPFNEDFKDAGTIPAAAVTEFSPVSEDFDTPEVGHATFRYSAPVAIEGGAQASDFGLYNLSALVQLRVAGPKGTTIGKNIDQIVLYSVKKQLLKQANLAADKIAAGKKGTELYTTTEGVKTISAIFGAPVAVLATDATPTSAYITVLPTTVEDLVILVHATDGTWAKVNKPNTVFEAGNAQRIDIDVKAADFKSEYIAVDEPSLINARNEARTFVNGGPGRTATVELIGDIELDGTNADSYGPDTYDFQSDAADTKITYKGDAIIVPEDVTLQTGTKIESDVRVLGKSCCTGTNGGILDIYGGTLSNVTIVPTEAKVNNKADYDTYNPWVIYSGDATIAAGKTFDVQAGNVVVNAAVQHKGDINIAEDVTLTVTNTGDLNFMGATVVNDGTIEVQKAGKFDMTDKNGNATANDGKRMTNNGKFIHNVDAGVGTAVQKMNQNGEYRCRVDDQIKLDDAYLQWTACSVIEMVNAGTTYDLGKGEGVSYKHNGKFIDFEINTTGGCTFTNPTPDDKEINIGNFTVVAGGLGVYYKDKVGSKIGKRTLTVNGDMVIKAGTSIYNSKKINIKKNLTLDGGWLYYQGSIWTAGDGSLNNEALAVTGDITVSGAAGNFDAGDVDALNITCANFKLAKGAIASFGNRTDGDSHNLTVSGKIDNPAGCTFDIIAANQVPGSVLAWVTCSELIAQGTFTGAKPRVE